MREYEPDLACEFCEPPGGICHVCQGGGKIVTYTPVARPPFDWCEQPEAIIECSECKGTGYWKLKGRKP